MTRLSEVVSDYRQAGPLHTLVSVQAAIDDHTFLTKAGDLIRLFRAEGVDYQCLDTQDLENIVHTFDAAIRNFGEEFRIYQYFVKRQRAPLPRGRYENPVVDAATTTHLAHLERHTLYDLEIYFAISYEGWRSSLTAASRPGSALVLSKWASQFGAARGLFSQEKHVTQLDARLTRARDVLANRVNNFVLQLRDVVRLEALDKRAGFKLLRRLLNLGPPDVDGVALSRDAFVDAQMCGSSLECHRDHLRLGDQYVQVLTLKDLPPQTFANMFSALQEIDCEFVLVSEWQQQSNATMRRRIQSQRRHHFNAKASLLNYVGSESAPKDMLIDDSSLAHVADLGACLRELDIEGHGFGQFSLAVVFHDLNQGRLRRAVAEGLKVFSARGAQLMEERYNLLNAFAAILPGNRAFSLRGQWLLNTNYADLAFLFTSREGAKENKHLRAEYLAVLETTQGTPFFLNLHCQDVAHSLVLGSTGSGKSFLLNFLVTHLQKYNPYTFIFDLGGSYDTLTQGFGGTYLRIASCAGSNDAVKINPFCLSPTAENLQFLLLFVRVLIESGGPVVAGPDERDLYEQIQNLYQIEPMHRRLSTLARILNRSLRQGLEKWVDGGPFASLFDNVEDTLTFSRFQTFDFEGMEKAPALEALLFYILHRANAAVSSEVDSTTFKVFVMDEAWRFLRHPTLKDYILEALKTWRKKNAAMILATQSGDDLLKSGMLSTFVENCPTKLFLANPGMDRQIYRDVFHLNETEADHIASLTPKRQFLVKQPQLAKVVNLNVDPKEYWLYTSDPYDREKKREAFERYGLERGLEILGGRPS